MITQDFIKSLKHWEIFASWFFENSPTSVYLSNDEWAKKQVRWVAVRWHIADWAIYYEDLFSNICIDFSNNLISLGNTDWSDEAIKRQWHKLPKGYLRKVIRVDPQAFDTYRD